MAASKASPEINYNGNIVTKVLEQSKKSLEIVLDTLNQNCWEAKHIPSDTEYYSIQLKHAIVDITYTLKIYLANLKFDVDPSRYEFKNINLSLRKNDPVEISRKDDPNTLTLILGVYVFKEDDNYKDAILVGFPINKEQKFIGGNPSLRVKYYLLQKAKIFGFAQWKNTSAHLFCAFRPEFIFHYLFEKNSLKLDNLAEKYLKETIIPNCKSNQLDKIENKLHNPLSELTKRNKFNQEPRNKIFYGAPGTGKSFKLRQKVLKELQFPEENIIRVTFHPSYTYQQFVGSYKPSPIYKEFDDSIYRLHDSSKDNILTAPHNKEPIIDYSFVPGPLLELLVKAFLNNQNNYILIIEEINRANVAAVFGDVFQLLDRKADGSSEYYISLSKEAKNFLKNSGIDTEYIKKTILPSNLFIWATMNNADQGVMPLDSAFKRRWTFEYIGIDDAEKEDEEKWKTEKLDERLIKFRNNCYNWNKFRKAVNKKLKENDIHEDKFLGFFYMNETELKDRESIKNKLLLYLREDVLRHKSDVLFQKEKGINTFSDIVCAYDDNKNFSDEDILDIEWGETSKIECPGESKIEDEESEEDTKSLPKEILASEKLQTDAERAEIEIKKKESIYKTIKQLGDNNIETIKIGSLEVFTLENSEKFCKKISKLYGDNNYWFGITPNVLRTMEMENVNYFIFILNEVGFVKYPLADLISNINNFGTTKNKENPNLIQHYQITIKYNKPDISFYGKEGFSKNISDFFTEFSINPS